MKPQIPLAAILSISIMSASAQSALNDGDWKQKTVTLKNTPEADVMVRVGDIDNLNFGFPTGFNPFCGLATDPHAYPWENDNRDPAGTDRIMIGSKFKPGLTEYDCGLDGYSQSEPIRATAVIIPTEPIQGLNIRNAALLLFVDDFQAPNFCANYLVTLNGQRFPEAEQVLNTLEQGGPIGKLVYFPLTPNLLDTLQADKLWLLIDDPTTGAADGFAIDFVKLIVNYKPEFACIGKLTGFVVDDETGEPIARANVEVGGFGQAVTNDEGYFLLDKLPSGVQVATASAVGYESGSKAGDVWDGDGQQIEIRLKRGQSAMFNGQTIRAGESIVMNNVLFDVGSSVLRPESKSELDKIISFLQQNGNARIELSGHTSSEGNRDTNVRLSFDRVNSCRDYIVSKGIDQGRILAKGYGPDRPIADNGTEEGRKLNRRVEMKLLEL